MKWSPLNKWKLRVSSHVVKAIYISFFYDRNVSALDVTEKFTSCPHFMVQSCHLLKPNYIRLYILSVGDPLRISISLSTFFCFCFLFLQGLSNNPRFLICCWNGSVGRSRCILDSSRGKRIDTTDWIALRPQTMTVEVRCSLRVVTCLWGRGGALDSLDLVKGTDSKHRIDKGTVRGSLCMPDR